MTHCSLQTALAVSAGKLSAEVLHRSRLGSGTTAPGRIGLSIDPHLLGNLGRQVKHKTIAITGTNGKSTTAGLLAAILRAGESQVVHNQLGANMLHGITTALLRQSSFAGRLKADFGVIEIDEASLTGVSRALQPDLTVVTNLFRDQLDRFGELDTTARMIRNGIEVGGGKLALNADDPLVTSIGRHFPAEDVIYYGVDEIDYPVAQDLDFPVGFPREVMDCPVCQAPLHYSRMIYGHLGHYECLACDFKRPKPWLEAGHIAVRTAESHLKLNCDGLPYAELTLTMPGLFNAYNLLAATTAALWLNVDAPQVIKGTATGQNLFGRAETRIVNGKRVGIYLIKNPIGAAEVLKVVTADPNKRILIAINDNYADSRDVSWLWDAPFEYLAQSENPIRVTGHRAEDMAVRLQYAGLPVQQIQCDVDLMAAFYQAVADTPADSTLYVLPTYTALLTLSQALGSR